MSKNKKILIFSVVAIILTIVAIIIIILTGKRETDRFIDDAYMAGLTQISIIHGKGTGILRSGISDMLKRHRLVKSHRLGMYGEGEDGVTIAELK